MRCYISHPSIIPDSIRLQPLYPLRSRRGQTVDNSAIAVDKGAERLKKQSESDESPTSAGSKRSTFHPSLRGVLLPGEQPTRKDATYAK